MTSREKLITRILLLIAWIVADNSELKREIKHLSNHISIHVNEVEITK